MALLDLIKEKVKRTTVELLDEIKKEAAHKIRMEIAGIKRQMFREFTSLTILLASIIFLSIAAVYLFIEYFMLSKTLAFLIVGIILLLIGIIIRITK